VAQGPRMPLVFAADVTVNVPVPARASVAAVLREMGLPSVTVVAELFVHVCPTALARASVTGLFALPSVTAPAVPATVNPLAPSVNVWAGDVGAVPLRIVVAAVLLNVSERAA